MSFAARETSRNLGSPDRLYRFACQNVVYAYTDAEDPITFNGDTYVPIPVSSGVITSSGTLDRAALTIDLPRSEGIAELFRVFPPSEVVGAVIYEGHADDPDNQFLAIWTGRILSCNRAGPMASLNCEPVSTSMKRPGLRRRYQYGCPHALYGPQCKAPRANFTIESQVVSINGVTLTFAPGWQGSFPAARFLDGLLEWTTNGAIELRTIIRVTGDVLTISGRLDTLDAGDTVKLSLGCNRQLDGCAIFQNFPNYGGQPWIPKKNPVGFVNQFY